MVAHGCSSSPNAPSNAGTGSLIACCCCTSLPRGHYNVDEHMLSPQEVAARFKTQVKVILSFLVLGFAIRIIPARQTDYTVASQVAWAY